MPSGRRIFVVDGHALVPLDAAVVVIRGKLLEVRLEKGLLDPPIEPEQLRLVLIHQLAGAGQPIIEEFAGRVQARLAIILRFEPSCRAVKIGIARIMDIRVECHARRS